MKQFISLFSKRIPLYLLAIGYLLLSLILFWYNNTYTHYLGGSYYNIDLKFFIPLECLIFLGCAIQYGLDSHMAERALLLLEYTLILMLISIGCTAVQYTPFEPIDAQVLQWDNTIQVHQKFWMLDLQSNQQKHQILHNLYYRLVYQIAFFPFLVILFGNIQHVKEFFFLIISTSLMGFAFYYFYPTVAPATAIGGYGFQIEQFSTGLKFYQLHQHIKPSTLQGGMIALPSFHVVWLWLCAYILREWRTAFIVTLSFNLITMIACVLLGWHYVLDLAGSLLLISIAHFIYLKLTPIP